MSDRPGIHVRKGGDLSPCGSSASSYNVTQLFGPFSRLTAKDFQYRGFLVTPASGVRFVEKARVGACLREAVSFLASLIVRTSFSLLVLVAGLWQLPTLYAEENLFSEVAMESVFEKNATLTSSVATLDDGEKMERITGTKSLEIALQFAGFKTKTKDERVTFEIAHAGWKLPVATEVELEQDRIVCEVSLIELADIANVDSDGLLKLLEKNDAVGGYFFAYDSKSKVIQLRTSFHNRGISAKQLKANLVQTAAFAERHSELWSKLKSKPAAKVADSTSGKTTTVTSGKPVTSVPSQTTVTMSSLTGLWGATLKGNESIAIQLTSDGTFKLATVKGGKSSLSNGKASLVGLS